MDPDSNSDSDSDPDSDSESDSESDTDSESGPDPEQKSATRHLLTGKDKLAGAYRKPKMIQDRCYFISRKCVSCACECVLRVSIM